jgi:hypothetical protein
VCRLHTAEPVAVLLGHRGEVNDLRWDPFTGCVTEACVRACLSRNE